MRQRRIAKSMLSHYVSTILALVMLDEPDHCDSPEHVSEQIFQVRKTTATSFGDFEALVLGVEAVLSDADFPSETLISGSEWDWEDNEVRPFLLEMRKRLWRHATPAPEEVALVVLTEETIHQWRERQSNSGVDE